MFRGSHQRKAGTGVASWQRGARSQGPLACVTSAGSRGKSSARPPEHGQGRAHSHPELQLLLSPANPTALTHDILSFTFLNLTFPLIDECGGGFLVCWRMPLRWLSACLRSPGSPDGHAPFRVLGKDPISALSNLPWGALYHPHQRRPFQTRKVTARLLQAAILTLPDMRISRGT